LQALRHCIERGRIARIGLDTGDAFKQPLGSRIIDWAGFVLLQALQQALAQLIVRHALAGNADHAEIVRQQIGRSEIVKRRHHQPMGEVAGGAEDDERAGIGLLL
jgi:hypothetical protein